MVFVKLDAQQQQQRRRWRRQQRGNLMRSETVNIGELLLRQSKKATTSQSHEIRSLQIQSGVNLAMFIF